VKWRRTVARTVLIGGFVAAIGMVLVEAVDMLPWWSVIRGIVGSVAVAAALLWCVNNFDSKD
jgi:hypothetical protein